MNDFKWTDELVTECLISLRNKYENALEHGWDGAKKEVESFKSFKTKKDWEIVEFKKEGCPHLFSRVAGGFAEVAFCHPQSEADLLRNPDYSIHAVRRLSDGQVFRVGDRVGVANIAAFFIKDEKMMVQFSSDHSIVTTLPLSAIKPPKQKLFTTSDGVDVFEGDMYFSVSDDFSILCSYNVTEKPKYPVDRTFSTREAADEYVWKNKPVFTYSEISESILPELKEIFLRSARHRSKVTS